MQSARVFKKEYLPMQELERQINQDQSGLNGHKKAGKCVSCSSEKSGKID